MFRYFIVRVCVEPRSCVLLLTEDVLYYEPEDFKVHKAVNFYVRHFV